MTDFDTFWSRFPRKIGKLAALKEYTRARTVATADEILAGVEQYRQHKPEYADWCHPKTFLSQGRWMDEYDDPTPVVTFEKCSHDPTCNSPQWCLVRRSREKAS